MLRTTIIANELATIERKLSETSNELAKDALRKKQARLKQELKDPSVSANVLAKTLLAQRDMVKALSKVDFNDLIRRLSKKPEYSFLKTMSKGTVKNDLQVTAKPVGWRFKGRGNYDKPTKAEILKGKKNGTVYREARPLRSDVSQVVRLNDGGPVGSCTSTYYKFLEFVEMSNDDYLQDANIVPYMEMNGVIVRYTQGKKKVAVIVYNPRMEKLPLASVVSKVITMFPINVQANINSFSSKYSVNSPKLCSATLIKIVNHNGELMDEFEEFAQGGSMYAGGGPTDSMETAKGLEIEFLYGYVYQVIDANSNKVIMKGSYEECLEFIYGGSMYSGGGDIGSNEVKEEYEKLKKTSIVNLRNEWSRNQKVGDPKGTDKAGVISDLLRWKFGNRKVDQAFGLNKMSTNGGVDDKMNIYKRMKDIVDERSTILNKYMKEYPTTWNTESRFRSEDKNKFDNLAKEYSELEESLKKKGFKYVNGGKITVKKNANNPNFLTINIEYEIMKGNAMALGKQTMSGQMRELSSSEAYKKALEIAKQIEQKYNIEDIEVTDLENGYIQIFAVSNDFIKLPINELQKFKNGGGIKNYPSFEVKNTIRVDDMVITPGYYTYSGRESGGKGVYLNVNNRQTLGFDLSMLQSLSNKYPNDIKIMMKDGGSFGSIKWKQSQNDNVEGYSSKAFPYSSKGDALLTKEQFIAKWSPRIENWIGVKPDLNSVKSFWNANQTFDFKFKANDDNAYRIYSGGESAKSKQYTIQKIKQTISKLETGGSVENESLQMIKSQNKEAKHHTDELSNVLKNKKNIEPWVIAKMERATSDLSDVTHYLDGQDQKMMHGGSIKKGETIYLVKTPYMASLSNLYDEPLEVIDIKTFNFASGPKLYYVVKTENGTQEVAEDMVETKMARGGNIYSYLVGTSFTHKNELHRIKKVDEFKQRFTIITTENKMFDVGTLLKNGVKFEDKPERKKREPLTSTQFQTKNAQKIKQLERERKQVEMDMEQEAEPEGGPIANRYGRLLNSIDKKIELLKYGKRTTPMTYEEAMRAPKKEKGGSVNNGDTIYVVKTPYMASLSNLYDKPLEVVDIKTIDFASGPKLYYVVKTENGTEEIAEDMIETKMNDGGGVNSLMPIHIKKAADNLAYSMPNHSIPDNKGNFTDEQIIKAIKKYSPILLQASKYGLEKEIVNHIQNILQNKMNDGGLIENENDLLDFYYTVKQEYINNGYNSSEATKNAKFDTVYLYSKSDIEREDAIKNLIDESEDKFEGGGQTPAQKEKIGKVMHEFKSGELHSGSKKGPIVTDRDQAIAIALAEANASKYIDGGEIKSIKKGDIIKDKYGNEAEVYYADGEKIEAEYKSGATYTYRQKDFDNEEVKFLWGDRNKYADGGKVVRERFNLSFNYNPSNISNEDVEKIVEKYTKDWKHNNDFDNVSFYVFNLTKEKADELKTLLKMEDVFNIEIQKSDYADGGEVGDLTKLNNLENYVYKNMTEIKNNQKRYGYDFEDIYEITNPYDFANLLGVDSIIFRDADITYYAEYVAGLLEEDEDNENDDDENDDDDYAKGGGVGDEASYNQRRIKNLKYLMSIANSEDKPDIQKSIDSLEKEKYKYEDGGLIINGTKVNIGDKGLYDGRIKENITVNKITPKLVYFTNADGKYKNADLSNFQKYFKATNQSAIVTQSIKSNIKVSSLPIEIKRKLEDKIRFAKIQMQKYPSDVNQSVIDKGEEILKSGKLPNWEEDYSPAGDSPQSIYDIYRYGHAENLVKSIGKIIKKYKKNEVSDSSTGAAAGWSGTMRSFVSGEIEGKVNFNNGKHSYLIAVKCGSGVPSAIRNKMFQELYELFFIYDQYNTTDGGVFFSTDSGTSYSTIGLRDDRYSFSDGKANDLREIFNSSSTSKKEKGGSTGWKHKMK